MFYYWNAVPLLKLEYFLEVNQYNGFTNLKNVQKNTVSGKEGVSQKVDSDTLGVSGSPQIRKQGRQRAHRLGEACQSL